MLFYQVYRLHLMHACFIVLQLRSDSCQIHGYVVMLALRPRPTENTVWFKNNVFARVAAACTQLVNIGCCL